MYVLLNIETFHPAILVHSAKTNHLRLFAEKNLRLPIIWEDFEMGDVLRIGWGASMLVVTETHRLSSTGGFFGPFEKLDFFFWIMPRASIFHPRCAACTPRSLIHIPSHSGLLDLPLNWSISSGIFRAGNSVPPTFLLGSRSLIIWYHATSYSFIQHHVDFRWSIEDGHFHISTFTWVILKDAGHLNAHFWLAGYPGTNSTNSHAWDGSVFEKLLDAQKGKLDFHSNHPTYMSGDPKIMGKPPNQFQIIPFVHGLFHYFQPSILGVFPLFLGNTHISIFFRGRRLVKNSHRLARLRSRWIGGDSVLLDRPDRSTPIISI